MRIKDLRFVLDLESDERGVVRFTLEYGDTTVRFDRERMLEVTHFDSGENTRGHKMSPIERLGGTFPEDATLAAIETARGLAPAAARFITRTLRENRHLFKDPEGPTRDRDDWHQLAAEIDRMAPASAASFLENAAQALRAAMPSMDEDWYAFSATALAEIEAAVSASGGALAVVPGADLRRCANFIRHVAERHPALSRRLWAVFQLARGRSAT